jgi:hypothetical protein
MVTQETLSDGDGNTGYAIKVPSHSDVKASLIEYTIKVPSHFDYGYSINFK